jgi:branched-chain amino acid transport system permease protein
MKDEGLSTLDRSVASDPAAVSPRFLRAPDRPSSFILHPSSFILAPLLLAVLILPLVAPQHYVLLMLPFFANCIILLGLNLLFGYTGLLSFGHALFLGLGAYTTAFFTSRFEIRSMEVILLAAVAVALAVAIPVGALCVRFVKIYFGLLMLAFSMVFYSFLIKFTWWTNGDQGVNVRAPTLLGAITPAQGGSIQFLTGAYYYYCIVVLLVLGFVMWRIVHSPFGLSLRAVRDNPQKAEYLGVPVRRCRWYAFLISAGYGGIGGALLAPPASLADPLMVYWTASGNLVFMTVLGGFGSFFGPILGAFVFIFLQDWLMSSRFEYWRFVFGAILALIVVFAPGGLMGLIAGGVARVRQSAGRQA